MKILLATDGAKQSDAAIDTMKHLRFTGGDEIKVVNVIDMALPTSIDIYGGYLPDTTELEKTARDHGSKILEQTRAKLNEITGGASAVSVTTEMLFGSPESRIVETAESWKADLIIVGSHGYSRWERLLLGSVSDSVVHHAPCSVLVVRIPPE